MSFVDTGNPADRLKQALMAALMGHGADAGTQFALPDDGSGMPKPAPAAASPSAGWNRDPGFTAKQPNFTGDPGMTAKLPDFARDPGMSFPAQKAGWDHGSGPSGPISYPSANNEFTLPPNTVSDLGGYVGPHSAQPVDTSRLDDLRARAGAIPDNGITPAHGLKEHLLRALTTLAPIGVGAAIGGSRGAAGAATAVNTNLHDKIAKQLALKKQLEGEAEQESQSVDKQRDFNISMQERQREFDQKQQEIQGNQDFQREMLKSSTKGGEGKTVDTGNGVMQFNPETNRYDIPVGPSKPVAGSENPYRDFASGDPNKQKAAKDFLSFENGLKAKPAGEAGTWSLQEDDKGNTVEYNSKTGQMRPAPAGLKVKGGKSDNDEKKRADMAENLNENLDQLEDIVKRRPELFGPMAGRLTNLKGALGSNDPDIASIPTILHNYGMATQGAHGMRSALGVHASAEALANGLKNGPDAIRAAIKVARDSVKTFTTDVERKDGPAAVGNAAPAAKGKDFNDPLGIR